MNVLGKVRAQLNRFYKAIDSLIIKYRRVYLSILCVFALLGYCFVLLFPLLVIFSGIHIYEILLVDSLINWQALSIYSAILLIAALISYRSFRIKPSPAVGLTMPEAKVPKIYELVRQVKTHFKRPAIHRIIITANYELDIVKTPKWILPVWSGNTLIIGLPLLLCLTPKQFECMMARRIGQFSKQQNPVTNWLYQLRGIWKQYYAAYAKQTYPERKIMQWFYGVYAWFYDRVSVHAARMDEMFADKYVMELYSHEDVREMITIDAVCRWLLQVHYWPAINKKAAAKKTTPQTPFRKLPAFIRTNVTDERITPLLAKVSKVVPDWKDPIPVLQVRLENIGHDTPHMSENKGDSAAEYFLGASLNGSINLLDKLWLKNNQVT